MDDAEPEPNRNSKQYTQGDKCLMFHLFLILLVIFLIIGIYIVHLLVVPHTVNEAFQIYRRRGELRDETQRRSSSQAGDLSYLVSVYNERLTGRVLCNGVLILSRWVLTSAHCVALVDHPALTSLRSYWLVKYGTDSLSAGKFTRKVLKGLIHPEFEAISGKNNIGLIKLHKQVHVQSRASLATRLFDEDSIAEQRLQVAGWANLDYNSEQAGDEVVGYRISPLQRLSCRTSSWTLALRELNFNEFCAVKVEHDTSCYPVTGAPVILRGVKADSVVAVASYGEKCGSKDLPLIFVKYSIDWVKGMIINSSKT